MRERARARGRQQADVRERAQAAPHPASITLWKASLATARLRVRWLQSLQRPQRQAWDNNAYDLLATVSVTSVAASLFFLYFCGRYNSALHRFAGLLLLLLLLRSRALRQSWHQQLRSGWFSREMCLTLVSTLQFFCYDCFHSVIIHPVLVII